MCIVYSFLWFKSQYQKTSPSPISAASRQLLPPFQFTWMWLLMHALMCASIDSVGQHSSFLGFISLLFSKTIQSGYSRLDCIWSKFTYRPICISTLSFFWIRTEQWKLESEIGVSSGVSAIFVTGEAPRWDKPKTFLKLRNPTLVSPLWCRQWSAFMPISGQCVTGLILQSVGMRLLLSNAKWLKRLSALYASDMMIHGTQTFYSLWTSIDDPADNHS